MNTARIFRLALGAIAAAAAGPRARCQAAPYSSETFTMGPGGFVLNYRVVWTCDDSPAGTVSSPGRIDLVDAGGNLVGQVSISAPNGTEQASVTGPGAVSNESAIVHIFGAGGTPADGTATGTWTLPRLGGGPYTFRLWFTQSSLPRESASTISTDVLNAGGGGPVGGPPTVTVSPPASAVAFQQAPVGATAASGGGPLSSVAIDTSMDNGATWTRILSDASPSSPFDSESVAYAFAAAGPAILRVTATDSAGLTATAQAAFAVAKADQPAVAITPASASVTAGQSVGFTASGGATGNYIFGGAASGPGPTRTVAFPVPGTFTVTVADAGDANHNPSPAASASVAVQAPFFTLSLSATAGGAVAGGGSYAPGAQASASATAAPGYAFTGWTGDATGTSAVLPVLMNSDKALTAHFAPMLAQTIAFASPGPVTTHSPPFALSATASSGLPVTLTLDSGPVTLSGAVATPTGAPGEVTVTATQAGDSVYLAAQPVVVTFAVGPPPPGVLLADDSAATRRTDRQTRTTAFRCGPAN